MGIAMYRDRIRVRTTNGPLSAGETNVMPAKNNIGPGVIDVISPASLLPK